MIDILPLLPPHLPAAADLFAAAFTRPQYRGRGLAPALLDLAIARAAQTGLHRMTVDFESINPEASAFWLRHYTPVCHSLVRIPEQV